MAKEGGKGMTKAEQRALEAYPHYTAENLDDVIKARKFFAKGYEQALNDIGIVNELIDRQGIAVVESYNNYSGHQTIDLLRFVGEDDDKPRPLPCKYYHVWLQAAKEEEL